MGDGAERSVLGPLRGLSRDLRLWRTELLFGYGDVPAHGRIARRRAAAGTCGRSPTVSKPHHPAGESAAPLATPGGTIGAYALVNDDEVWQATMRAQLGT